MKKSGILFLGHIAQPYWYRGKKSSISLPLFKTKLLLTDAETEGRKQRGGKEQERKKQKSQTDK